MKELINSSPTATVHIFTLPPIGTAEITYPPEFELLSKVEQEEVKRLFGEIKKKKTYPIVRGGFGDMPDCDGIVEQVIEPAQGGRLIKLWGCSQYFKGYPEEHLVERLGFGKSLVSQIPKDIVSKSWFWRIVLVLRYLFARRLFMHDLRVWCNMLYVHSVEKSKLQVSKYNAMTREMKRTGDNVVRVMLDSLGDKKDIPYSIAYTQFVLHQEGNYAINKRNAIEAIANFLEFLYLFLEYDNAYRFRLQDVFPLLDKKAVEENVTNEVKRLLDVLIDRELSEAQKKKWISIKRMVLPLLWLDYGIRTFVKKYLLEINLERVKPDEHDHYFTLRRTTYRFRDIPVEERVKEAEKIDREKGHVRMQLIRLRDNTTGRDVLGIKVIQPQP